MPAISPTLSGIGSVAYTTMEEKAEAMINPDRKVKMMVHVKLTKGMAMAKGAAPRMENQMTYFLPNLSPSIPPATVPMAKAARNTKRHSCEVCTETELIHQEEGEVARDACRIEILGEHEHDEDKQCPILHPFEIWVLRSGCFCGWFTT